jgi:hypothetical protein
LTLTAAALGAAVELDDASVLDWVLVLGMWSPWVLVLE